jgi:hypothetical protein
MQATPFVWASHGNYAASFHQLLFSAPEKTSLHVVEAGVRRLSCFALIPLALWEARAEECKVCHPKETQAHAESAHAHAVQPVLESHFYKALPERPIGEARGGFLLDYQRSGAALEVIAQRDGETARALIEWVFGAGRRAETPVAVRGDTFLEHRISYYTAGGQFDLTMGHRAGASRSAVQALGIAQPAAAIERCFGCHRTAAGAAGIQCASCHAGAQDHAEKGGPVRNPGRLKPAELIALCAACHRAEPEGDSEDPINVRYQVARLKRSKCYQSGKISCLTCHDPHTNASADAGWYRSRCLACHAEQKERGDCTECHMKQESVTPRLVFTDHYIR